MISPKSINFHLLLLSFFTFSICNSTALLSTRDTLKVYYPTDCYNTLTQSSYSEISYYSSVSTVQSHLPPDSFASINLYETIKWHDNSWTVTIPVDPFTVTIGIGYDAPQASIGDIIGSSAVSPDFVGVENCYKQERLVISKPNEWTDCYAEYASGDVLSEVRIGKSLDYIGSHLYPTPLQSSMLREMNDE
ncbi:uncharacterized protein EAE97_010868 [Botrytis byssoidea]|uniref:Peptidase A1 domain-containing protein n=1 Tax=Botrytis byssoidea TaxID=139641 RepID=A0A9P5LSH8_9HELO|nr:uncharacterized protein EAE97_010868 [Botrytis byssoidea]KAF7923430.1 hypothetical protein EAE97_010868 [Botrytis byssoidea]